MKVTKSHVLTCLGLILIMMLAAGSADAGLFGLWKTKKTDVEAPKQSLLVFPFDADSSVQLPDGFGKEIAGYLRTMISDSREYSTLIYRDELAPIRRAKDESTLKDQDLKAPFAGDNAKSGKLAQIISADYYVVGSVEGYSFDSKAKVATMTISAEMWSINGRSPKLIGNYMATGKADSSCNASSDDEFRSVAAGKAIEALKDQILPKKTDEKQEAK